MLWVNLCMPIHLLILTSLWYLGRGWTFDDCEEATAISEDVCHVFFHEFVLYGQKVLFPKYVVAPQTQAEVESCMAEFSLAGFPGCIGSMDASHVCLECVEFRLRQPHLANKLHTTARSYNIVTNHCCQILSTTEGHPATWNDKTLVRFDCFVMGMKKACYHSNLHFKLYAYDVMAMSLNVPIVVLGFLLTMDTTIGASQFCHSKGLWTIQRSASPSGWSQCTRMWSAHLEF
jgi:hypothetical protein